MGLGVNLNGAGKPVLQSLEQDEPEAVETTQPAEA